MSTSEARPEGRPSLEEVARARYRGHMDYIRILDNRIAVARALQYQRGASGKRHDKTSINALKERKQSYVDMCTELRVCFSRAGIELEDESETREESGT